MLTTEMIVCSLQSLRRRATPCHAGPHREQGFSGGRGNKGRMWVEDFTVVFSARKRQARQAKQVRVGLSE